LKLHFNDIKACIHSQFLYLRPSYHTSQLQSHVNILHITIKTYKLKTILK